MTSFKFVEWSSLPMFHFGRRSPWWMYHRLANAGRFQIGRLILMWPLPWCDAVKNLPGYGYGRPSGIRSALGWKQKEKRG